MGAVNIGAVAMGFLYTVGLMALTATMVAMAAMIAALAWKIVAEVADEVR